MFFEVSKECKYCLIFRVEELATSKKKQLVAVSLSARKLVVIRQVGKMRHRK
jgi:hypothetical protein